MYVEYLSNSFAGADFCRYLENFVKTFPETKLVTLSNETLLPGNRTIKQYHHTTWKRVYEYAYNALLIFMVHMLLTILFMMPKLGKILGAGKGLHVHEAFHKTDEGRMPYAFDQAAPSAEEAQAKTEQQNKELQNATTFHTNFGAVTNKFSWKTVSWPRAMRVQQLFSNGLHHASAVIVGKNK